MMKKFSGINRRMQFFGMLDNTYLIDDYGHHPTEIKSTIQALRESFPKEKITMVFQPHRFSRTRDLFKSFVEVLLMVDKLILLEIYSAGEESIKEVSSEKLLKQIKEMGSKNSELASSKEEAIKLIESSILNEGGVLLIQGAGNISDISEILTKQLDLLL